MQMDLTGLLRIVFMVLFEGLRLLVNLYREYSILWLAAKEYYLRRGKSSRFSLKLQAACILNNFLNIRASKNLLTEFWELLLSPLKSSCWALKAVHGNSVLCYISKSTDSEDSSEGESDRENSQAEKGGDREKQDGSEATDKAGKDSKTKDSLKRSRRSKKDESRKRSKRCKKEDSSKSCRNTPREDSPKFPRSSKKEDSPKISEISEKKDSPKFSIISKKDDSPKFSKNSEKEDSPKFSKTSKKDDSPKFSKTSKKEDSPNFPGISKKEDSPKFLRSSKKETSPKCFRDSASDKIDSSDQPFSQQKRKSISGNEVLPKRRRFADSPQEHDTSPGGQARESKVDGKDVILPASHEVTKAGHSNFPEDEVKSANANAAEPPGGSASDKIELVEGDANQSSSRGGQRPVVRDVENIFGGRGSCVEEVSLTECSDAKISEIESASNPVSVKVKSPPRRFSIIRTSMQKGSSLDKVQQGETLQRDEGVKSSSQILGKPAVHVETKQLFLNRSASSSTDGNQSTSQENRGIQECKPPSSPEKSTSSVVDTPVKVHPPVTADAPKMRERKKNVFTMSVSNSGDPRTRQLKPIQSEPEGLELRFFHWDQRPQAQQAPEGLVLRLTDLTRSEIGHPQITPPKESAREILDSPNRRRRIGQTRIPGGLPESIPADETKMEFQLAIHESLMDEIRKLQSQSRPYVQPPNITGRPTFDEGAHYSGRDDDPRLQGRIDLNLNPERAQGDCRSYPGIAEHPLHVKKDAMYQKRFYKKPPVLLPKKLRKSIQDGMRDVPESQNQTEDLKIKQRLETIRRYVREFVREFREKSLDGSESPSNESQRSPGSEKIRPTTGASSPFPSHRDLPLKKRFAAQEYARSVPKKQTSSDVTAIDDIEKSLQRLSCSVTHAGGDGCQLEGSSSMTVSERNAGETQQFDDETIPESPMEIGERGQSSQAVEGNKTEDDESSPVSDSGNVSKEVLHRKESGV